MHALDVLGDPVRRRILELLADGERAAGEVGAVVQD
jgi:DNA-binding transcriptional ArsR family regulator